MTSERSRIIWSGLLRFRNQKHKPLSSEVLACQLRQKNFPAWTAWYVPYGDVENDLWGKSHFNFCVDQINYHVLRTGAFPFVKFHCSKRPPENLIVEDIFYRILKVKLGIPTLLYGIAGLLWAQHTEEISISERKPVVIYYWYKETPGSKY